MIRPSQRENCWMRPGPTLAVSIYSETAL